MRSQFSLALIGEVDAGKSTTLGQILLQTGSILESRIQEADRASRAQNKDFEPAFLLDAFEYERQNEMTVDITSVSCKLKDLDIRFLDTPGHKELSNKFIGGASYADLALLILDSHQVCIEDNFRHARMLNLLGLRDFAVIVNKWDSQDPHELQNYIQKLKPFLDELKSKIHFILPVSAKTGVGFEVLLDSLRSSLLSLKFENNLLVTFKQKNQSSSYWAQIEQGSYHNSTPLFDELGPLQIKSAQSCGMLIHLLEIENRSALMMATSNPESIRTLNQVRCSIVPLQEDWSDFTVMRTKWGKVSAHLKSYDQKNSAEVDLQKKFPFFSPSIRANLFTLEKANRIVAVGVPQL